MGCLSLLALFLQDNILSIDGSFFVILVLVLVLIVVLNSILFKPINRILDERERLTTGSTSEVGAIIADSERRLAHYEETIARARAESYRNLEARRRNALAERARIIQQAKDEVAEEIRQAKSQIALQVSEAKSRLEQEAREIAVKVSSNILRRGVGGRII